MISEEIVNGIVISENIVNDRYPYNNRNIDVNGRDDTCDKSSSIFNSFQAEFQKADCISSEPLTEDRSSQIIEILESQKPMEHRKKDSLVTKFLQRLSKPDLLSKPKKANKVKSKNKPFQDCTQSDDKSITIDENMNHNSGRSKRFRKIFKRFGKRKAKNNQLSDSSSCIGSKPSVCSTILTSTNVNRVGSCNDVTNDKVGREELDKYNSSSVDCLLDFHVKKLLKERDQESVSSTSEDLREHEQKMNAPNGQIESIFPENNVAIINSHTELEIDKVVGNIEPKTMNVEERKNLVNGSGVVDIELRQNQSPEGSDVMLRKSSRPNDIQLRRSRVTSQSSMARSSLIMVAVSYNSPRSKGIVNHVGSPLCNQDSPSYPGRKLDFEDESKVIYEEKTEKIVTEKNGNDFLKIAAQYEIEINAKIEIVQQYMKSYADEMNDDVIGELNTAVGLAKLLLNEKFVQFRGLCNQNVNESNEHGFKTLCCDLEGYLTTLEIQMADLNKNFQLVEKIRENKWQMIIDNYPIIDKEVKIKKMKPKTPRQGPVDTQRSLEAKKRIAEYKKMCASNNKSSANLFVVE